ncbi:hypothetical protein G9A89_006474 [Geosiphon pyriformis]|nr:hypothetical protein G9A89_006474 [Geosiphon pyriformis]
MTSGNPRLRITQNWRLAMVVHQLIPSSSNQQIESRHGAALEEKPITAMYTDAKIDGHPIKFILNSGSAGSIITKQLMNQLGCQVD